MKYNITEKLNELDTQAFMNDEHCYDLVQLYSGQELSDNKKTKLVEMLQKENINQEEIYNVLTENILDEKAMTAYELEKSLADPEFIGKSYYGPSYSGLEDDFVTTNYEELKSWIWDKLQRGNFVEASDADGLLHRYSPDKPDWDAETFDIDDYLIENVQPVKKAEPIKETKSNIKRIFQHNLTEGFIKDAGDTATDMCRLLDEEHIWNELYDYSKSDRDDCYFIDIEINGDWKHDHLRSDWILDEWATRNNYRLKKEGVTVTEEDGSDWYKGVHHYIIFADDYKSDWKPITFVESLEDMDSADSYMSKKKFTNGTLAEFDPQNLMNKVAETGYAINTIRENGDNTYFISIHYKEWFGPKGIDNPEEVYYVDVIKETADGKQTREVLEDGTATEIVNILNEWKASVSSLSEEYIPDRTERQPEGNFDGDYVDELDIVTVNTITDAESGLTEHNYRLTMSDKNNNSKELFFNTKEDAQDAWQFIAKKEKQWKNAVIGKVLN